MNEKYKGYRLKSIVTLTDNTHILSIPYSELKLFLKVTLYIYKIKLKFIVLTISSSLFEPLTFQISQRG
jgi:hypothetical protein